MSIAENIARLQGAKESLKSAINAKGGKITTQRLDEYADVVLSIITKDDIDMSFITASENFVVISKGYVPEDKTITISEAAAPVRNQNVVHVYPGYVNNQIDITIPKATLSVVDNEVSIDEGYSTADSVIIPEMDEPTVDANVVSIGKGYNKSLKTVAIPEAKPPFVDGAKVTIYPGYIAQEQIIEVVVSEPEPTDKTYVYTVSGAGISEVNGTYTATGNTVNGYPQYSNGSYYLLKTHWEEQWGIIDVPSPDDNSAYMYRNVNYNDPADPTSGEWTMSTNGMPPPPTVTKSVGNSGNGNTDGDNGDSGNGDDSKTDNGYLVSGSGAGDYVNGTYLADGEKNGLPIYKCSTGAKMECEYVVNNGVQMEERAWKIYDSTGGLAYYQYDVKDNMPDSGEWRRSLGPDPVPTVTKL